MRLALPMLVFALATVQHDIGAQAPAAETEFATAYADVIPSE